MVVKDYRMSLVILLVPEVKAGEWIDGDGLWLCIFFTIITKVPRQMESHMERN